MFRLAWRIVLEGSSLLPDMITISDDVHDADAVRRLASEVSAEAFGAEFLLTREGQAPVYTTALEIAAWDPVTMTMPNPATTIWGRATRLKAAATHVTVELRAVLDKAAAGGLLADDEALGLRRAADIMIADRLAS